MNILQSEDVFTVEEFKHTRTIALIKAKIISNTKIKKYAEISNLNYRVGLPSLITRYRVFQ